MEKVGSMNHKTSRLQNSRFFPSKSVKKSVKRGVRVLHARNISVSPQSHSLFSASFQTFCLTARAYFDTQKYGLFCSLPDKIRKVVTSSIGSLQLVSYVVQNHHTDQSKGCIGTRQTKVFHHSNGTHVISFVCLRSQGIRHCSTAWRFCTR